MQCRQSQTPVMQTRAPPPIIAAAAPSAYNALPRQPSNAQLFYSPPARSPASVTTGTVPAPVPMISPPANIGQSPVMHRRNSLGVVRPNVGSYTACSASEISQAGVRSGRISPYAGSVELPARHAPRLEGITTMPYHLACEGMQETPRGRLPLQARPSGAHNSPAPKTSKDSAAIDRDLSLDGARSLRYDEFRTLRQQSSPQQVRQQSGHQQAPRRISTAAPATAESSGSVDGPRPVAANSPSVQVRSFAPER